MSTPRRTRLHRVANLRAFQRAIRLLISQPDLSRLRSSAVLVPSSAAADQLRRTLENHAQALCLPLIFTRSGWYDAMHARMASPPARLTALEREVLLKAAAREIEGGPHPPPFKLRAGLLVEMLALYDDLRRRNVSVDRFESAMTQDLERDAASDRGAERLLGQTRFLAAAFRGYEARLAASGRVDEHALRERLLQDEPARPLRQVVVTVGDRTGDAAGLWKADFDLLTRLPLLEQVDVVATQAALAAGLLDRLRDLLPEFEEGGSDPGFLCVEDSATPVLVGDNDERPFLVSRDREDELTLIARRLKSTVMPPGDMLDRRAVVFKRPLPYVYLAHDVFRDAGIPYQTFDALPLAAEPYAAALDIVFEFVTAGFTRETVIALLTSPHFHFGGARSPVTRADAAALDRALHEAAYFGGGDHLRTFAARAGGRVARAARAAVAAADELQALGGPQRPSLQLAALQAFLAAHDRIPAAGDPLRERHLRARTSILSAIEGLRRAHQQFDDGPVPLADVAAMIRRWIEGQTFAPRTGVSGVQILDAQAARYGEFDEMFLVGLVEGEWPEHATRSIFYPQSLLSRFESPSDEPRSAGSRAAMAGERAAFDDLVRLPLNQVTLSTFELEHDSSVGPSVFLEDVDWLGLPVRPAATRPGRISVREALTGDPIVPAVLAAPAREWLDTRAARSGAAAAQFHGTARAHTPAAHSVSSLERYLRCPFIYFSERVLELREDPEDEATLTPKDLGIFVHAVFQSFFERWSADGHRSITPANLPVARQLFREVLEPLLETLSQDEAAVQRARLLGSAADEGLAEAVFQVEAEWDTPVVSRLLEHPLVGEFELQSAAGPRRIALRGKADRIDLLADHTLRIIDYKLGYAPDRKVALQLPIYSLCAVQQLRAQTGTRWETSQAGYIAFGEDCRFVPMLVRGQTLDEALGDAQVRLLDAVDAIGRGEFPPTPAEASQCARCAYAPVCRKDYVGDV